jgi:hypothetical protein
MRITFACQNGLDDGLSGCSADIGQHIGQLQQREDRSHGAPLPEEKREGRLKKKRANKPQFDLREGLFRMTGTDLTRMDGIDVMTATTVISEAGYDMSKWRTRTILFPGCGCVPTIASVATRSSGKVGCPPIIPSVSP